MKRIMRCRRGLAVIEFGLLVPILLLFFLGMAELSHYALIHQKLDKATNAMGDFLTQSNVARYSDMDGYAASVAQIMKPFEFKGSVIFSSINFRIKGEPPCIGDNVSCIAWQYNALGVDPSRIGKVGENASLPGKYDVLPGQIGIAAEIYFDYHPLIPFTGVVIAALGDQKIYKVSIYKPRQLGGLTMPPT